MKGVYIFLAQGFEDMEALSTADVLRRGQVPVKLVSITEDIFVESSHGITVRADMIFSEFLETVDRSSASDDDAMVFPGGMPGTKNLASCAPLMDLMREHHEQGGLIAAICAAPGLVLSQLDGRLDGLGFTCYDGFESYLVDKGAEYLGGPVVLAGDIITGRSAGYSVQFALEVLSHLRGQEVSFEVRKSIMMVNL